MNRAILLIFAGVMPHIEEPSFEKEELFKLLEDKSKYVSEVETVMNEQLTPKEYGLKRMKAKRYKDARRRR